jgi:hypothetical protein
LQAFADGVIWLSLEELDQQADLDPLLNRRCGPLSESTNSLIPSFPLEQLEALAESLLDFSGPADLAAWLAEHSG